MAKPFLYNVGPFKVLSAEGDTITARIGPATVTTNVSTANDYLYTGTVIIEDLKGNQKFSLPDVNAGDTFDFRAGPIKATVDLDDGSVTSGDFSARIGPLTLEGVGDEGGFAVDFATGSVSVQGEASLKGVDADYDFDVTFRLGENFFM